MAKANETPEGFVVVTRQIIKDNVYMGDEERTVWGEKAAEQLSLPNEERNPHWRNVKYKEEGKKQVLSEKVKAETVEEKEQQVEEVVIPRKRNRNV